MSSPISSLGQHFLLGTFKKAEISSSKAQKDSKLELDDGAQTLSKEAIKVDLIARGILPTPEGAKKQFWALGEDWWKQIIDGNAHKYGPEVFDKGLHGREVEPGFLKGVEDGCRVFTDRLQEELNFELYRDVHHAACRHFRGKENGTLYDASEIDNIRTNRHTNCEVHFSNVDVDFGHNFYKCLNNKREYELLQKHADTLNKEFKTVADRLGCSKPFVTCYPENQSSGSPVLTILYTETGEVLEKITHKLIDEFNQDLSFLQREAHRKLSSVNLKDLKKGYHDYVYKLIARLFAGLEWLHPWPDGQGRTDLILLNGLLCREGLHPCFLDQPYHSSAHSPNQWEKYLMEGLEEYKRFLTQKKLLEKSEIIPDNFQNHDAEYESSINEDDLNYQDGEGVFLIQFNPCPRMKKF